MPNQNGFSPDDFARKVEEQAAKYTQLARETVERYTRIAREEAARYRAQSSSRQNAGQPGGSGWQPPGSADTAHGAQPGGRQAPGQSAPGAAGGSRYRSKWGTAVRSGGATAIGVVCAVLGGIFALTALGLLIGWLVSGLMKVLPALIVMAVLSFLCLGGSLKGFSNSRRVKRFNTYCSIIGARTHCTVRELAAAVMRPAPFVVRDLQKMISLGYFTEAYMDEKRTRLFVDAGAYREFCEKLEREDRAGAAREQRTGSDAADTVLAEGASFLSESRALRAQIADPEVAGRVERIEQVADKIFHQVSAHPGKAGQIRKFTTYYLPTTLKMLRIYTEVDVQDLHSENIATIKENINGILYTINSAFENLLDSLFEDEVLDISSDIVVLQTLLRQEGLLDTEDGPAL